MGAVAVAVIIVVCRSGGPGEPVEPSPSGSRVYRAHPETAPTGKTLVALPIVLVHTFVELNGKHTDTGIEPGTPILILRPPHHYTSRVRVRVRVR